ncbi:MAG: VanZ family protein [Lachnospiraceae bacterium]|jgi:VanZ family protein|nr:VanZ family protein [Lachnospiraceae bacterium]
MNKLMKILLFLAMIFTIIAIIFYFSDQTVTQSHSASRQVATAITNLWVSKFPTNIHTSADVTFLANCLDGPVRKVAHLFIYNLLGFFGYYLLWRLDHRRNSFKKILAILLLIVFVATLDEINQYYSGGRGSSIHDVLLDLFGGCIGIYIVFMLRDFKRHIQNGLSAIKHKS